MSTTTKATKATTTKAPEATTPELFSDIQSGRVVCFRHLGGYGQAAVKANPRAPQWVTPLDVLVRCTPGEIAEMATWFESGPICEDCRGEERRAAEAGAARAATVEDVATAFDLPVSMIAPPPAEPVEQPASVTLADGRTIDRPASLHPSLVIRGVTADGLLVVSDTTLPTMPPWALTACCNAASTASEHGFLFCKGCYGDAHPDTALCGEYLIEIATVA